MHKIDNFKSPFLHKTDNFRHSQRQGNQTSATPGKAQIRNVKRRRVTCMARMLKNMSNHEHRRKNPPVTQPPQSGNISAMFLFCRFHNRDIDGIAIFVRLIRSINAIRKREAMASISTTAQAIPQTPPQTPSHPSIPISSTVKAVPRSGIRDVFDRALAGDADELREGLRRLRTFAEQI